MAKKSKKKNNINFAWLGMACLGVLVSVIGLFLNIFSFACSEGGDPTNVKLFCEWPKLTESTYALYDATFHGIWATLFEVLLLVGIVAVVVAVLVKMLVKKSDKIVSIINILAFVAILVGIICGLGFSIANTVTGKILETTIHAKWAIGAYLMAIGSAVALVGSYKVAK